MHLKENSALVIEDLLALAQGEIAALRIPNYLEKADCEYVTTRLAASSLFGYYQTPGAENIGRVGEAFCDTKESYDLKRKYESESRNWIRLLRREMAPRLTPIDKLRLELDETWPNGATVAYLDGKKLFVGLARFFAEGASAEPHQDVLAWDVPHSPEATLLSAQWAANIYCALPEKGGELKIWPRSFTKAEYEERRHVGSYGLSEEVLPSNPIVIQPQLGELIIFNSRLAHSVTPVLRGTRFTWSCFVGVSSSTHPLALWS